MKLPIRITLKTEILPLLLLAAGFAASFYFYRHFPDRVPTHWNFQGVVDGYSGKAFAAYFFPIFNIGLYLLFLVFPALDPKRDRYVQFEKQYHIFKTLFVVFMTAIYFIVGFAGMGYQIAISTLMPIMVGVLFMTIGNYLAKIKPNWFMGIRTPWTLSSETVWTKTHRLGGKLFILLGIVFILNALIVKAWSLYAFIGSLLAVVLIPIVYSYLLYRKERGA